MNQTVIVSGKGKYALKAVPVLCGEDVYVAVTGGTRNHIGAVAMAVPRQSLSDKRVTSATASVLCNPGHKDDMPARNLALRLSSFLNRTVCVSVGIHIDGAGPADLEAFQKELDRLYDALAVWMKEKRI